MLHSLNLGCTLIGSPTNPCQNCSIDSFMLHIKYLNLNYYFHIEYGYSGGGSGGGGGYGGYSSYDQTAPAYGGPAPATGGWGNQGQSSAPYSGYTGADGPVGGYSTQQGSGGAPSTAYPSGLKSYKFQHFIFLTKHFLFAGSSSAGYSAYGDQAYGSGGGSGYDNTGSYGGSASYGGISLLLTLL